MRGHGLQTDQLGFHTSGTGDLGGNWQGGDPDGSEAELATPVGRKGKPRPNLGDNEAKSHRSLLLELLQGA